jgi:hypothetical protein
MAKSLKVLEADQFWQRTSSGFRGRLASTILTRAEQSFPGLFLIAMWSNSANALVRHLIEV